MARLLLWIGAHGTMCRVSKVEEIDAQIELPQRQREEERRVSRSGRLTAEPIAYSTTISPSTPTAGNAGSTTAGPYGARSSSRIS